MAKKTYIVDIDVDGNKIENLPLAVNQGDATSKDFIDEMFIDNLQLTTFTYDSNITNNPNISTFRLNNAVFTNVTQMYIHKTDLYTFDLSDIFSNLFVDNIIKIKQANDTSKWVDYKIISATDNITYYTINVAYNLIAVNGGPATSSICKITFFDQSNISGLTITNPYNTTLIQSASGTGGVADGTNYVDGTNISIIFPSLPVGAVVVSSQVLITYTSNNPSYLSELMVRMTPPNSAQQSDLITSIANISGTLTDIILANFTTTDPVGTWLFEFRDTINNAGVDVNITDVTINCTYTLDTNLYDFNGVVQAKKFIGDGSQLINLPEGVKLVKAYLTQTQAINVNTPNTLTNHVFIIPPGKSMSLRGVLVFTSAAINTGAYYGVLVSQPTGADGNAIGSFSIGVSITSAQAASELRDGDAINVAAAGSLESGVLGTASVAGNNSGNMILNVTNTSTNVSTVVEIRFRSETNGTAVTAQIGTSAIALIG